MASDRPIPIGQLVVIGVGSGKIRPHFLSKSFERRQRRVFNLLHDSCSNDKKYSALWAVTGLHIMILPVNLDWEIKVVMRRTTSTICLSIGIALFAIASTQAEPYRAKANFHRVPVAQEKQQRVCDWVGPGGRAVYRCKIVEVIADPPQEHRTCGWVGPAAPPRAIYACR